MKSVILTASVLLCCLCGLSASKLEIHSVEAKAGDSVTLRCPNLSNTIAQMMWFRVTGRPSFHCAVSALKPHNDIIHCDGFPKENFVMSSNVSEVFLTIDAANASDSGLYFCGFPIHRRPLIVEASYLKVHDDKQTSSCSTWISGLVIGVMGAVTIILVMVIICLVMRRIPDEDPEKPLELVQDSQQLSVKHLDEASDPTGDLLTSVVAEKLKDAWSHQRASEITHAVHV